MTIIERALEFVPANSRIGLGSGRAARAFVNASCERRLNDLGCQPVAYRQNNDLFVTDNGNHILDCQVGPIPDPLRLEREIRAIPGVIGTGLFLGLADTVLVGDRVSFELIEEKRRGSARGAVQAVSNREPLSIRGNME